jgi:hypothetical protein
MHGQQGRQVHHQVDQPLCPGYTGLDKELFIQSGILSNGYIMLLRGMNLREMADYKETYSQSGAENLITSDNYALAEIEKLIYQPPN